MKKQANSVKVVAVRFNDDNVSALYIDGKLAITNNDYDDNSLLAFESFAAGVEFAGKKVDTIEWLSVEGDEEDFPSNDGSNIPDHWPDGKWSDRAE